MSSGAPGARAWARFSQSRAAGLLLCACVAGGWPSGRATAEPALFPRPPEQTRLDNGLSVVTLRWPSPGVVAYYTLVRVGSRDEVEPGHTGFAHLFEHMMFHGTKQLSQAAYEARMQALGADNNAYTTQDFTLYTVTAPSAALQEVMDVEADRFQHLDYDEAAFRTETGAVLGEYHKSASSPFLTLWEALSELAFSRHTYAHTTLGRLADVRAMPDKYAYSKAFFHRFYTPDNTTIFVVGDVVHKAVVEQVRARYAGWSGERDHPPIRPEDAPKAGAQQHVEWAGAAAPQLLWGYRTPAFQASDADGPAGLRDTAALEVVHALLADPSSDLFQGLVVRDRKLLDFSTWAQSFSRDPGLFVLHAELAQGTTFEEMVDAVQAAVDAIARGEQQGSIDAVRSHLAYALPMQVETVSDAADTLAQFVAMTGRPGALSAYLAALYAVTAEDVARVASTYLKPSRRFVVSLTPAAEKSR